MLKCAVAIYKGKVDIETLNDYEETLGYEIERYLIPDLYDAREESQQVSELIEIAQAVAALGGLPLSDRALKFIAEVSKDYYS